MKVLFVLSGLGVGGLEKYLYRFLQYSQGKKIQPVVMCKGPNVGKLKPDFEKLGVEVVHFPIGFFSLFSYVKLFNFLKGQGITSVCDFTGDMSGGVLFIARLCGIEIRIASYRESRYQFVQTRARMLYIRCFKQLTKLFSTDIISNSKAGLDFFHPRHQDGNKFSIINNGIPTFSVLTTHAIAQKKSQLELPQNAFVIGHVGRYTAAKNHGQIIEFFNKVVEQDINVHLVLCGSGVKENLAQQGVVIHSNIHFIEYLEDVSGLLQCLDLFYFPSLNEGQPNALLEAMSVGVPIIASNIHAIETTVPDFMQQSLVEPNDLEGALALYHQLRERKNLETLTRMQSWVREKYCVSTNFDLFLNKLLGS